MWTQSFSGRPQSEVQGADKVLLCKEQQSLSLYLLGAELLGRILTTWRKEDRVCVPG